jgi:hypothetical protein
MPGIASAQAPSNPALTAPTESPLSAPATLPTAPPLSVAEFQAQYGLGEELANQLTESVGIGITPLLGMGALGAWRWYATDVALRASLPWYQHPWFWSPLCLLALVSIFGGEIPIVKRVVRTWKLYENKCMAVLSVPVIATMTVTLVDAALARQGPAQQGAAHSSSYMLASVPATSLAAFTATAAVAATLVVMVMKNAIDVLILISPFSVVDWFLRLCKLVPLTIMLLAAYGSPWLGAAVALVVLLVCALFFGWSMRLGIMGSVFVRDIVFRRWRRVPDPVSGFKAFAMAGLSGVPRRTYGRIVRADGARTFRCRWFFIGPMREVPVPAGALTVERGLFFGPELLLRRSPEDRMVSVAWCAPALRYHEDLIAAELGATEVRDCAILRGMRGLWAWIRGVFRGKASGEMDGQAPSPGAAPT